jgi:uncharacterized protein YcbX
MFCNQEKLMRVGALWVYPVKSCRGLAVEQSEVTPKGLSGDREWMIVDEAGRFLTQRTHPKMTQIGVSLEADHLILSDARGQFEPIAIPLLASGCEREVQMWQTQTLALDQGDTVADWLTCMLDRACRLVRQSSDHPRSTDPTYAPGGTVSFADGYPLLLTTTASLADLNRRIQASDPKADPVSMRQFRPNIVVELDDDLAFEEDDWQALKVRDVTFDCVKPCDRCIVTTTDQDSGDRHTDQEPLRTLATFRRFNNKLMFGENLVPRSLGSLRRGDLIEVLAAKSGRER